KEVVGYGKTLEDAHQEALREARAQLATWLAEHAPPFVWNPTAEYIEDRLVKEKLVEDKDFDKTGPVKERTLKLELSTKDYREMVSKDRAARSNLRMIFLGKMLAGLVAVFGAFAGYFRLEEATKGFYTTWLRLGAVGLVAMVGAGLYWLR